MTKWTLGGLGLALLVGGTPRLAAQVPAAPPPPGPPPLVAPAAPAPAPPSNIWSKLFPTQAQKTALKECICKTQIGQLLNNSLAPVGAFSGGLLGPCCPPFNQADLLKPSDSPEGAAAKIKADEAGAKARVAAVKYLARVDCSYWPEAADALVNALRKDRNECVRFAAAQALGTGCCCGKVTIVALSIAAAGSDRDGNPAEKSDRVRFAAQAALENCLARCGLAIPVPTEGQRERPPSGEAPPIKPVSAKEQEAGRRVEPAAFYKKIGTMQGPQVVDMVRQSAMTWTTPITDGPAPAEGVALGGGHAPSMSADHSLVGLLTSAIEPAKASLAPPGRQTPPRNIETVKVDHAAPVMMTQGNAIQTVGYESPSPRAWTPGETVETKPASVAPAATVQPAYVPPAPMQPVRHIATPPVTAPLTHFPPANGVDFGQTLTMLRDGADPGQRAWAASELSVVDARGNPDVVDALIAAGQLDRSPAVRVACIRSLVKMNATSGAVRELMESLQNDTDAAVQQEARAARSKMAN